MLHPDGGGSNNPQGEGVVQPWGEGQIVTVLVMKSLAESILTFVNSVLACAPVEEINFRALSNLF